jgi:hypothetical protein
VSAGRWDTVIEPGATWERRLTWTDAADVPVPLAGCTARMHVRSSTWATDVLVELTTENGRITLTDPGVIDLVLSAAETETFGQTAGAKSPAVYDLEIVDPTQTPERVTRLLEGRITVSPEVTRPAPLTLAAVR